MGGAGACAVSGRYWCCEWEVLVLVLWVGGAGAVSGRAGAVSGRCWCWCCEWKVLVLVL